MLFLPGKLQNMDIHKQLLLQKEQAELKAKVARTQKDSLKTKKNKL